MIALRLLGAASLLAVGFVTAVAAVVVHTLWWGLPLVAAGVTAALAGVGRGWLTRLPLSLGFLSGVVASVLPRAEGGYLVASGTPGWLLLLTALLATGFGVVTLPHPRRARDRVALGPPA